MPVCVASLPVGLGERKLSTSLQVCPPPAPVPQGLSPDRPLPNGDPRLHRLRRVRKSFSSKISFDLCSKAGPGTWEQDLNLGLLMPSLPQGVLPSVTSQSATEFHYRVGAGFVPAYCLNLGSPRAPAWKVRSKLSDWCAKAERLLACSWSPRGKALSSHSLPVGGGGLL